MTKYLIINGHQFYPNAQGRLNQALCDIFNNELSREGEAPTTIIEQGYNTQEEVQKIMNADCVIAQIPSYWFGAPWIYKKYIDEVFNAGHGTIWNSDGRSRSNPDAQYGTGGLINGTKKFMLSVTWNAPEDAFNNKMHHIFKGKSVGEAMSENHPYAFCGFKILPTFSCHDVIKAPNIDKYTSDLINHIHKFIIDYN